MNKHHNVVRETAFAEKELEEMKRLNPSYYRGGIQCWDYIASQGMDFFVGNIVKYVTRYKTKNGVEDLKKARTYLDKLIELEEGKC